MRCNECEREFVTARCTCGWTPPTLTVGTDWIVTHCSHPQCHVAIRHRMTRLDNPLCKWHQAGTAYPPLPDALGKSA